MNLHKLNPASSLFTKLLSSNIDIRKLVVLPETLLVSNIYQHSLKKMLQKRKKTKITELI